MKRSAAMERGIKFWEKRRSSQDIVGRLAEVKGL
jgi:hypothetical protein